MNQLLGTVNAKPHSAHEGNHRRRVHRLETQNDVTPTCHSKSVLPALRKQPAEKCLSRYFVHSFDRQPLTFVTRHLERPTWRAPR